MSPSPTRRSAIFRLKAPISLVRRLITLVKGVSIACVILCVILLTVGILPRLPANTALAVTVGPKQPGVNSSFSVIFTGAGNPSVSFFATFTDPDIELADALFLGCMAAFFGMDTHMILEFRGTSEPVPPLGLVSLFYISADTRRSPGDILIMRKKGHGWGRLAKIYGLPANYHGKLVSISAKGSKKAGKVVTIYSWGDPQFEEAMYVRFISAYYAVPESDVVVWLSKGFTYQDIAIALNLSARVRVAPATILALRAKGTGWKSIAGKYKVRYEDLAKPVPPKRTYSRS